MQTDSDVLWKIPSKLAVTFLGVLLGGAISFNAWAVAAIYDRPSKTEVKEMIIDTSPFSKERALILDILQQVRRSNVDLKHSVDENTREIAKLRVILTNE